MTPLNSLKYTLCSCAETQAYETSGRPQPGHPCKCCKKKTTNLEGVLVFPGKPKWFSGEKIKADKITYSLHFSRTFNSPSTAIGRFPNTRCSGCFRGYLCCFKRYFSPNLTRYVFCHCMPWYVYT